MENYNISGIQQVGIGVNDLDLAWSWYAKHFGMDLQIFNDEAEAKLMQEFTGNEVHKRRAILAMNLQGGGGFEVWQFTSRKPKTAPQIEDGDLGITHVHLRTKNAKKAWDYFHSLENVSLTELTKDQLERPTFVLTDPFQNRFKIIEDEYLFMDTGALVGGVMGVTIGVSDLNRSLKLYQDGLKYDQLESRDKCPKGMESAWLTSTVQRPSAFSDLLGPTGIELVCDTKQKRPHSFEGRYWGDEGFIHVCFDVQKMNLLREKCDEIQHCFKVDSENSFDMGEAAGQFAYVQDNDETLIELVETHKVPIMKKLGWYINLKNKKEQKPLPKLIFHVLNKPREKGKIV